MTTTIDGTNVSTFAAGVTCTALNGGQLGGNRNRINNGDMRISQRHGTSAVTVTTQTYFVDQYLSSNTTGTGTITAQQSTLDGAKSFKILATAAITDLSADKTAHAIQQRTEAYNTYDLNSKTVTLSFKVQTNWSGNLPIAFHNTSFGRSYIVDVSVSSGTNTISTSVPLEAATIAANDNNRGVIVTIGANQEGNARTGTTGSWVATTSLCSTSSTQWMKTINNYINVTEIQLEEGSVATPFEHRSYGEELALCQRYLPAFNAESTTDTFAIGTFTSNAIAFINYPFLVEPRVTPTGITISNVAHVQLYGPGGGTSAATGVVFNGGTCKKLGRLQVNGTGTPYTAGQGAEVFSNNATLQLLWTGCEL